MREVTNPREKPFIKNSEWKLSWITFCGCFILFHFIFFSRSLCVSFILPTCLAVSFFFSSRLLLSHYIYYNYSYTSAFLCFLFLLIVRSFNFIVSLVQWSYSMTMCEIFHNNKFCTRSLIKKRKFSFKFNSVNFSYKRRKKKRWGRKVGSINGGRHIFCLLLPKTNKN